MNRYGVVNLLNGKRVVVDASTERIAIGKALSKGLMDMEPTGNRRENMLKLAIEDLGTVGPSGGIGY